MKRIKLFLSSLVLSFIGVPVFTHGVSFLGIIFIDSLDAWIDRHTLIMLACVLGGIILFGLGWIWARYIRPKANNAVRHTLLLIPELPVLVVWISCMFLSDFSFANGYYGYVFYASPS